MTNSKIKTFLSSLGDLEKAELLIDPKATFIAVRENADSKLPLYGTFVGLSGLEAFVNGLREAFDTQMFLIDNVLETDTIGFATGRFIHRIRSTGKIFKSHWAVQCEFNNGLIIRYRFFEDTAALEEAMGIRTICKESFDT